MARRDLAGLRALVTGASSGIGQSLAVELAKSQVHCVLVARRADRLEEVAKLCREQGAGVHVVVGDVTDSTTRQAALDTAQREFGGLDLLVNNAGVSSTGDFAGSSPELMRSIFEVNFFAATELTRSAIPFLREGRSPMIVNVGSILGHRGSPLNSEYCASKFALTGWTQSLRAELACEGIDVLLVSPGTTKTEFSDHRLEQRVKLPWSDVKAVSADYVARATVRAIRSGKHEIVPNIRGWWMLLAHRLAPTLVDRILAKIAKRAK